MDAFEKLKLVTSQMHLEPVEDSHCPQLSPHKQEDVSISTARLPNGRSITLLKSQLSTVCERNCYYCPFRAGRDFKRTSFSPEEFARLFLALHRSKIAEGIFLSSGIVKNGLCTQDRLIDTADILRNKLQFRGYIHLKIMPGAEFSQVERAMQLADRVSINLEAPTSERLQMLAPSKIFMDELVEPLKWIDQIRNNQPAYKGWSGKWPSSATQFVISAVGETDLELMGTTEYLYKQLHLKRTYFSNFNPISDTPLENVPPGSPIREHRLYEASFLLRDYGFCMEELPFDQTGNLPLDLDPKSAWAKINLTGSRIEINNADVHTLLRVPGIGPKSADSIIKARIKNKLKNSSELHQFGVILSRASPFIQVNGKVSAYQPRLF